MSQPAQAHDKAIQLAEHVLTMTTTAGSGHPSSALSLAHLVVELMYSQMRYDPTQPTHPASDRLEYYLKRVGGPTESADRDHIFLVKADGSVVTRENVGGGAFSGGLMSARVEPGDSIVVPEKLIRPRLTKELKDWTQILYQIAVTAGVLIVVF